MEPLSVGLYACKRARMSLGDKVLVCGAGKDVSKGLYMWKYLIVELLFIFYNKKTVFSCVPYTGIIL